MSEKIRSRVVFCQAKQREVEIEYVEKGSWCSSEKKLKFCPASHDGGNSCDYACLKTPDATSKAAFGRYGPGYYF